MLKFVSLWACLWVSYINTAQHAVHAKLIAPPLARHQGRSGSGVPGYTQLHDTDCAVAACQTIKRLDLCGSPPAYPLLPPCNTTYLASLCDELAGCAGFNTNGWAKQAIPPRSSLENTSACDLFVRNDGPTPPRVLPSGGSGPPVQAGDDIHYPTEEMDERRSNPPPQVTAVAITDHGCEVTVADSVAGVPGPIPTTNGTVEWVAYGCFHASGVRGATVAVGQTFRRWSRLVFLNSTSVIVDLRSSVGSATDITQLRYNFTAREPNYFDRAHREYNDYLGRRIVNGSRFGEPNFVETSRYLAPAQEYAMIGTNNASVKWIVCPDGVVKRSDQALLEPVLDASPARCEFGDPAAGYYLSGYPNDTRAGYSRIDDARNACCAMGQACGGVTIEPNRTDPYTLRASREVSVGKATDMSWICISCALPPVVFSPVQSLRTLNSDNISIDPQTSVYKSGLLGGSLRVVGVTVFDEAAGVGFESLTFAPNFNGTNQILVRIRCVKFESDKTPPKNAPQSCRWRYFRYILESGLVEITDSREVGFYYAALLNAYEQWTEFFEGSLELQLPTSVSSRQFDMTRGAVVLANTDFVGLKQNYGAGSVYWAPGGSLMLTTAAMSNSLLRLGVTDRALDLVGYYIEQFVAADGTLPGFCASAPTQYNDGLADYGRLLQLYVDCVHFSRNGSWANKHSAAMGRVVAYLLRLRSQTPQYGPVTGLIFGPAEHDRCGDPDYYFDINVWGWRGLVSIGRLHASADPLPAPSGLVLNASWGIALLDEAAKWQSDIYDAIRISLINETSDTSHNFGKSQPLPFLPSVARAGQTPWVAMWMSINSSYANFRYWPELLSAEFLSGDLEASVLRFRDERCGSLSGMSTFVDHLDDMPSEGFALGHLRQDDIPRFLLQLHGHMANYQSRGTFGTTEQFSLYNLNDNRWRDYMPMDQELSVDFCTPSQLQVSLMTTWQLVLHDPDTATVWLAKGVPRSWYQREPSTRLNSSTSGGFQVRAAPTKFGHIDMSIASSQVDSMAMIVSMQWDPVPVAASALQKIEWRIRVRWPDGFRPIASASSDSPTATIIDIDVPAEIVSIRLGAPYRTNVTVHFDPGPKM